MLRFQQPGIIFMSVFVLWCISGMYRYLKRDPLATSGLFNNQITSKEEKGTSSGIFDRMVSYYIISFSQSIFLKGFLLAVKCMHNVL